MIEELIKLTDCGMIHWLPDDHSRTWEHIKFTYEYLYIDDTEIALTSDQFNRLWTAIENSIHNKNIQGKQVMKRLAQLQKEWENEN